jgi:hypothetical protein
LEKKGDFYLCHFVGEEKWPKKWRNKKF